MTVIVSLTGLSAEAQQYHYSPYEKPDPFNPGFFTAVPKEALPALQTLPLERLVLVGTIIGGSPSGLISVDKGTTGNQTYLVRVGDKIGIRSGTIVSILKDRIIIREPLESGDTRDSSRFQDTAIMLRLSSSEAPADLISDLNSGEKKTNMGLTEALIEDVMPTDSSAIRATKSGNGRKGNSSTSKTQDSLRNSGNNFEVSGKQEGFERQDPIQNFPDNPSVPTFNSAGIGKESNPFSTTVIGGSPGSAIDLGQQTRAIDAAQPGFGQTSPSTTNQSQGLGVQAIPTQSDPNFGIGGSGAPVQ
jgi:hypothetical protein